jgi:DNA-directed RNA polymerase specialized sigma24 family protein
MGADERTLVSTDGPDDDFSRLFPPESLPRVRRRLVSFFHFHGWRGPARDTPEDLAHETLLRGQRRVAQGADITTDPIRYLLGIARNVAREDRRAAYRETLDPLESGEHLGSTRDVEKADNRLLARDLLAVLSKEDRAVLVAYVLGDRPKLVRRLGTTAGALRVRIHRILARLRQEHRRSDSSPT